MDTLSDTNFFLASLSFCIVVLSGFQFGYSVLKDKRWKTNHLLFIEIMCHALVRMILLCMPLSVYLNILASPNGVASQICLDLLPEIMYLFWYVLLTCSWVNVLWKTKRTKGAFGISKRGFWIMYIIVCIFILFFGCCVVFASLSNSWSYNTASQGESIYLSLMIGITMAFTLISGLLLTRMLKDVNPESMDSSTKEKWFLALVIVVSCSELLKIIYLDVMNNSITAARVNGNLTLNGYCAFWFFYYLLSEIIPAATVLIILFKLRRNVEKEGMSKTTVHDLPTTQKSSTE